MATSVELTCFNLLRARSNPKNGRNIITQELLDLLPGQIDSFGPCKNNANLEATLRKLGMWDEVGSPTRWNLKVTLLRKVSPVDRGVVHTLRDATWFATRPQLTGPFPPLCGCSTSLCSRWKTRTTSTT